jgi:hypothetical protein
MPGQAIERAGMSPTVSSLRAKIHLWRLNLDSGFCVRVDVESAERSILISLVNVVGK